MSTTDIIVVAGLAVGLAAAIYFIGRAADRPARRRRPIRGELA